MDLRKAKAELRREIKARRDGLSPDGRALASDRIRSRVLDLPEVEGMEAVFAFLSHGSEVRTAPLIDALLARGLRLSVPRVVDGHRMVAVSFPGWDGLVAGVLGIPAPPSSDPDPVLPGLVITPGLAFTRSGDRLGHGRGYYDRWFGENPLALRVAIAFGCQVVETLPTDAHDIPVDLIVTEEEVIRIGRRPPR